MRERSLTELVKVIEYQVHMTDDMLIYIFIYVYMYIFISPKTW